MDDLIEQLKDLVFAPRNPYASLDNLLAPYERLLRAAYEVGAEAERERIAAAALAIRADYPEDVFPTLPAAAGARLAIDRLLAALD